MALLTPRADRSRPSRVEQLAEQLEALGWRGATDLLRNTGDLPFEPSVDFGFVIVLLVV